MRRYLPLATGFIAGAATVEVVREISRRVRSDADRPDSRGAPLEGGLASVPNLSEANQSGRGRDADRPGEIPIRGWKDILVRTWKEFGEDQIPLIAAGCTFYSLLALFPGVTAFVALYGLFADVGDAQRHVQEMSAFLPSGAISLIGDQMLKVAAAQNGQLSFAFILGLVTALWSANGAMKAVISGLNIAYEEKEKRGFFAKVLIPLGFTVAFLTFAISAIALAAFGATIDQNFGATAGVIYDVAYWVLLFAGLATGMTILYRFGPSRSRVRWRWISWGSGLAAVSWLVMSGGFSFYVANFGSYDESYGALGAVIGFMTWTWLSSIVLLLGAELNSEIEHQTARDTTTGAPLPLGRRGAVMADTIGQARS